MNGQTTNYTLDLNAGLTQVLSDGTNIYVYGLGRIAQVNTTTEYFLGDALGSVRQLVNAGGTVTYTKAYDPYGVVRSTSGDSQSAFGYTGEFTSNDMVYLRARYYASSTGRFLTRDTWMGDENNPMSFNAWLYTNSNPILYTDPSGNVPCDMLPPEDQVNCIASPAPNTEDYNEKNPPWGIQWISNKMANNINRDLAPIYNANGNKITNTNAAQFQIAGHEKSSVQVTEKMSSGDCKKKGGDYDGKRCTYWKANNVNFCGQVVLSAILSQLIPDVTAQTIADALDYPTGTTYTDLADFLNRNYGDYVTAEAISAKSFAQTGTKFYDQMTGYFNNSTLIMPMVTIISGNSYPEGDPEGINGQLGTTGGRINHWILITGISKQWKQGSEKSPYNWVRVLNPFDNQAEYYWWPDFRAAWENGGWPYTGNYTAVKIHVK